MNTPQQKRNRRLIDEMAGKALAGDFEPLMLIGRNGSGDILVQMPPMTLLSKEQMQEVLQEAARAIHDISEPADAVAKALAGGPEHEASLHFVLHATQHLLSEGASPVVILGFHEKGSVITLVRSGVVETAGSDAKSFFQMLATLFEREGQT